jgi:hypothetical protein
MHDYERLKRLTGSGDVDAAKQLQRAAQRRADAPAEALAAAALGDVAALLQGGADAWGAGDWPRLLAFSDALGAPISASAAARINTLCAATNARTPDRQITHAMLLHVLHAALTSPDGWSVQHTGVIARKTCCVVALAAFNPETDAVTLGIGNSLRGAPSPGGVWPQALSPWRPPEPSTFTRLAAWRDASPDDQPDNQRVRLDRSVSAAHALLRDATAPTTAQSAWLRQVRAALRSPRQPSGWLRACQLLQSAPGYDAQSAESARALALSDPQDLPRAPEGKRAWLKAALALGDDAASHWRLTRSLYLTNLTDPLLTSTCAAMEGLENLALNHTLTQSVKQQARVFSCLHRTPHLPHLELLDIEGARLDAASVHTLFGDPAILPALKRLNLKVLRDAPDSPWPPLRRALDALYLHDARDAGEAESPEPLLRWLADAPAPPKTLTLRLACRHPPSEPRITLARTADLSLHFTPSSDAAAVDALLSRLDLPWLNGGGLDLSIPALTEATLDAIDAIRSRCDPEGAAPSLTLTVANTKLYPWQVEAGIYAPRPTLPPDLLARLRDAVLCDWKLMAPA